MKTVPSMDDLGLADTRHLESKGSCSYYDVEAINNASNRLIATMKEWGETLKKLEVGMCQPDLVRTEEDRSLVFDELGQWAVRVSKVRPPFYIFVVFFGR